MWTSARRSRAAHATRSRQVGVAAALLACFGLAACTATESPSPASTAETDTIAPFPESGVIDAGTIDRFKSEAQALVDKEARAIGESEWPEPSSAARRSTATCS